MKLNLNMWTVTRLTLGLGAITWMIFLARANAADPAAASKSPELTARQKLISQFDLNKNGKLEPVVLMKTLDSFALLPLFLWIAVFGSTRLCSAAAEPNTLSGTRFALLSAPNQLPQVEIVFPPPDVIFRLAACRT